jgi:two-component system chemotaxis response regulator CheB
MKPSRDSALDVVALGASAGGLAALRVVLAGIPESFPAALLVVQHRTAGPDDMLAALLSAGCSLMVKDAEDKEIIRPGIVYVAPPDYHLLVEQNMQLALSVDMRVTFARPSIDVLFETAAEACRFHLTGVLLSGANHDGTEGMRCIRACGGVTVVQDPASAEFPAMPRAAIDAGVADHVIPVERIAPVLVHCHSSEKNRG